MTASNDVRGIRGCAMCCSICGAALERSAGVCIATIFCHTPSNATFLERDLAILKAARELAALVRGAEVLDVPGGNTLISLGMARLVRAIEDADGRTSLQADMEGFIRIGEEIAAELRTGQAADCPQNVRHS